MLSEALPAKSWDFGDQKVDRAEGACSWDSLVQPGLAWVLLGVVDPDTAHCGSCPFLTVEQYVAERHGDSHRTLARASEQWIKRETQCVAKCQKVFCLDLSRQQQLLTNRKMSVDNRT